MEVWRPAPISCGTAPSSDANHNIWTWAVVTSSTVNESEPDLTALKAVNILSRSHEIPVFAGVELRGMKWWLVGLLWSNFRFRFSYDAEPAAQFWVMSWGVNRSIDSFVKVEGTCGNQVSR